MENGNKESILLQWYNAELYLELARGIWEENVACREFSLIKINSCITNSGFMNPVAQAAHHCFAHLVSVSIWLVKICDYYSVQGQTILQNYRHQLKDCTADNQQLIKKQLKQKIDNYIIFMLRDWALFSRPGNNYCAYTGSLNQAKNELIKETSLHDIFQSVQWAQSLIKRRLKDTAVITVD